MSWVKHFSKVNIPNQKLKDTTSLSSGAGITSAKFSSYLPEVYAGHPNRIQRYYQYDDMDRDSDIHSALDTIADFCTQSEEQNDNPFEISYYGDDATETEVKIIKAALTKWTRLNTFRSRLWDIFRKTIKNGDQFFLRDPETGEWLWVDHFSVEMVKVDDTAGKDPDEYIIRGLDYNKQAKFATGAADPLQYRTPLGTSNVGGSRPVGTGNSSVFSLAGSNSSQRGIGGTMGTQDQLYVVDAQHVIHLSLTNAMDLNWPFGESVLEPLFKVYKQKELLEDAIIIYRVQRAPERRIFYIDTGSMPSNRAKAYIEQIKNEIHQRRIPNRTGGGACIDLETRIPLLDGRTLPLKDMIVEYDTGKENWVYSVDPETGRTVPGKVSWAGITRKNAKVIRITLDNGEVVTCTPDHKIPVWGKGFVEASELTAEDSLFGFNTRMFSINEKANRKLQTNNVNDPQYIQIFDNETKTWVFVHRMVANFMQSVGQNNTLVYKTDQEKKSVIHHNDFNKYNNDPDNLVYMNGYDHFLLHTEHGTSWQKHRSAEELKQIREKQSQASSERWKKLKYGFQKWSAFTKTMGLGSRKKPTRQLTFNRSILNKVTEVVKSQQRPVIATTCEVLNRDVDFINEFISLNQNYKGNRGNSAFTQNTLKTLLEKNNYKSFSDFKEKVAQYNHRIVSIMEAEETMDVGTITVDGNEDLHGFHTFAIEQGIFIKNSVLDAAYNPLSTLDDYFFATGTDGRGSKVETLPGGELVGEIGDLLFFSKKLARGLRIPPLYLFGDDANSMAFNDGKLGTALVQEFLFNKYCMRLQSLLAKTFDYEFKYYLRKTGIEIDENMFELKFCTPQNFAKYRQIELDTQQIQVFTQIAENKFIANRTKLKKYLNWSDDEILENEKAWKEENPDKIKKTGSMADDQSGLSAVGVRSGAMFPDTGAVEDNPDSFAPDDGSAPPAEGGGPPVGGGGDGGDTGGAPMGGGGGDTGGAPQ